MSVALAGFFIFAITQIGTPGPANMILMATGAKYGLRSALPFVAGVVIGKQLIIWPIGFGLMELATFAPPVFIALKWISGLYIIWLAWRISQIRFTKNRDLNIVPGFFAGLLVHPLNPKAWALITTSFTAFTISGFSSLNTTFTIASILLLIQLTLHPCWTLFGATIGKYVAGTKIEKYLMWSLAAVTLLSVLSVLLVGDT
jgi:threonine/homoserine/homoserine lactone efflux protein